MSAAKITVIILNWNGKHDTLTCLSSISEINYSNFDVIVVDNGSSDGSVKAIRKQHPDITIIETGENLGFAEGNNVGIRQALSSGSEYLLLLNNDTWVDKEFLNNLASEAKKTENQFVYGPVIYYAEPDNMIWFAGAKWNNKKLTFDYPLQNSLSDQLPTAPFKTDYICGAALFFHRSIAEKIGLLDKKFFLVWEESDWCYRAKNAGHPSLIVPNSKIWHKIGVSFGSESSPLRLFFSARNRLLWIEKNLSRKLAIKTAFQVIYSISPKFSISTDINTNLIKRLYWALLAYLISWKGMLTNTPRRARLLGVLNYLIRNFGDCPAILRK